MNIENKHTGPQFDRFGNKVEAKAKAKGTVNAALSHTEIIVVQNIARRFFNEFSTAENKLNRIDRRLFDALHESLNHGPMRKSRFAKIIESL